jgi:arabinan endo-1,5-alpha-L-arabinosidase
LSKRQIFYALIGAVIIIAVSISFLWKPAPEYQNPVFEPVLADPSIIKAEDGYYYAYGTEDDWGDGKGARYIPVIRSQNLIDWEYVGEAFGDFKPTWKGGGLWAPDITFYNDKYYLYYSLSVWGDPNPGIGVAISDNPVGPFEDQGPLFTSKEIGVANSIDPFFYLEDGTPYLFWGSFNGIYGVELTKDGLNPTGDKFQVAGNSFEAPYIIKRDGFYYFFGSIGSCCDGEWSTYRVGVGRSETLQGPYLDQDGNDIMYSEGTLILAESENFAGPGHNAIVTDDKGTDWILYHAINKEEPFLGSGATRRPLMIDPIIWEDGWPTIKGLAPSEQLQKGPRLK